MYLFLTNALSGRCLFLVIFSFTANFHCLTLRCFFEAAKRRGELSAAEYIQLKHQAQNAHERRLAYDRFSIELITED